MLGQRIKNWFLTVDKTLLMLIMLLSLIGCMLVFSSGVVIAGKLNLPELFFIKKHLINLVLGFSILFVISMLNEKLLRQLSLVACIVFIFLIALTNVIGAEIKGSTRWLNFFGFNMQPSEFLKPFYIVVLARIFSLRANNHASETSILKHFFSKKQKAYKALKISSSYYKHSSFPAYRIAVAFHFMVIILLLKQPDLGMAITYTVIFIALIFLSGISIYWLPVAGCCLLFLIGFAYKFLPHVAYRINSFLYSGSNANYQVEKSVDAYVSGGIFGQGPLGGNVKNYLPDCHTDFIFAVAAEEFGAIFAILLIILILSIAIRALVHGLRTEDSFKFYTISGIAILYAFQSIFNIGVTLKLLPTKGMTLPFISYGGSSIISFMVAFGILLNFTKKNFACLNIRNKNLGECILED